MKILHLSYYDIVGSQSLAAYRIHKALLKSNIDSYMLVAGKKANTKILSSQNINLIFLKIL